MVRGNWQKRVESAQARREEQRARKARKGDRQEHRQMASGLMAHLARYDGSTRRSGLMHVWVDSDPRKSSGGGGGRAPAQDAARFDSDDEDGGRRASKKGGGKKQSRRPQQDSAKKAHPRQGLKNSHHFDDGEGTSAADAGQLCVRHFFHGKCAGLAAGGKKGGGAAMCKLQHMRDTTLALALKKVREAEGDIAASASAAIQAPAGEGEEDQVGAAIVEDASMSMLWYLPVPLEEDMDAGDNGGRGTNEVLQSALSRIKLGAATIVYVVLDKKLLYDRNRGGVIEESIDADDNNNQANVGERAPRKHGRSRGESMAERKGSICEGEDSEANILVHFPASVLESILTYLPDMYTGNLPRICKAWHAEIGKNSPNLWYQLLLRRELPLPVEKSAEGFLLPAGTDVDTAGSPRDICRNAFVSHYEAFRDLRSIHELFLKLQQGQTTQTSIDSNEACVLHYNSSPGAPREGSGHLPSMKIWSEGKLLAAFEEDCTLRLFEAKAAGEANLACRQTVSVIVSPEPKSKRGQWEMTGMDLDEQYVSCICQAVDQDHEDHFNPELPVMKAPFMHIVKREDLLCASGGGSDNRPGEIDPDDMISINLRDAVCQHLLNDCWGDLLSSAEESNADLIDLIENEERPDLHVYVNRDLVACGRGRFLFKAALLPRDIDFDDEQVSFRAYLYSVSARKITWSESVHVSLPLVLPLTRMYGQTKGVVSTSSAIVSYPNSDRTMRIDISKDDSVQSYEIPVDASHSVAIMKEKSSWDDYDEGVQVEESDWNVSAYCWRPALLTSSDLLIACQEIFYNAPSGDVKGRTVVTFSCPSNCASEGTTTDVLTLKGRCRIDDMQLLGPDHVILIGEMLPEESITTREEGDMGDANEDDNDIAGEWFGVADDGVGDNSDGGNQDSDMSSGGGCCISLVHVPSRREIKRYKMFPVGLTDAWRTCTFASGCDTIALEVHGGGLIMGGRGARDALSRNSVASNNRSDDVTPKSKKKKRQATRAKGRNKDGFARGMSGRG